MSTATALHAKFELGGIYSTPGALHLLEETGQSGTVLLARHLQGDWGDMCADDRQANDEALTNGSRIFSAYKLPCGAKVWIITEADRSSTTILLPEEY
jgi:hypothetical protein